MNGSKASWKILALIPILALAALAAGCEKKPESVESLMLGDPITEGPSIVREVAPEMPFTGMQQIVVESIYGDKSGKKIVSLEFASTALNLRAGDYVLVQKGKKRDLEKRRYGLEFRLVSRDMRYSKVAQTERLEAIAAEKAALEELEKLRKAVAEEPPE
jgi:hypothetical protein